LEEEKIKKKKDEIKHEKEEKLKEEKEKNKDLKKNPIRLRHVDGETILIMDGHYKIYTSSISTLVILFIKIKGNLIILKAKSGKWYLGSIFPFKEVNIFHESIISKFSDNFNEFSITEETLIEDFKDFRDSQSSLKSDSTLKSLMVAKKEFIEHDDKKNIDKKVIKEVQPFFWEAFVNSPLKDLIEKVNERNIYVEKNEVFTF
jgi:hypothetical protein